MDGVLVGVCLYTQLCSTQGQWIYWFELHEWIYQIYQIRSEQIRAYRSYRMSYSHSWWQDQNCQLSWLDQVAGNFTRQMRWTGKVWLKLLTRAGHKGATVRAIIVDTTNLLRAGNLTIIGMSVTVAAKETGRCQWWRKSCSSRENWIWNCPLLGQISWTPIWSSIW